MIVDFVITARGCVGECNYCSIAAYTSEQRKSYRLRAPREPSPRKSPTPTTSARRARVLRAGRPLRAAERAKPSSASPAAPRRRSRARRGDLCLLDQGPSRDHQPAVVPGAPREMGAIHMFLGVENASAERLSYLGRTHLPLHNDSAIGLLRGTASCRRSTSCSSIRTAPSTTSGPTLDMAERNLDLPVERLPHRDLLGHRAPRAPRSRGAPARATAGATATCMRDERAEVMFRIMRVSFHERALAIDSLLNRLISLSFARQLHEHFFPSRDHRRDEPRRHRDRRRGAP